MIKENIEKVKARINEVCLRIKADPGKIVIVCVAKGRPVKQVLEAVNSGLKNIGENRVQEALEKYERVSGACWHMVGHLQSNKIKDALKIFDLIHSVDSLDLAQEINKQALKINKIQDVLLEVKTSGELTKFGFQLDALADAVGEITKLKNVNVKGLMTIAALADNSDESRPYFAKLRQLRDKLNPHWLLSMGMSDDFSVAIEEGADIIRIGRRIFSRQ